LIDLFAIGLTHGLLLLAAWRLVQRPDLDPPPARRQRPGRDGVKGKDDTMTGQRDA